MNQCKRKANPAIIAVALAVILLLTSIFVPNVHGSSGDTVTGKKTGTDITYLVLGSTNGSSVPNVQVGDGTNPAVDITLSGQLHIPEDAMIYEAWELSRVYPVTTIGANAFKGCQDITSICIEGTVSLDTGALDGLPEGVTFETHSTETKKALLQYGIPLERITYTRLRTKYVAFGDSIAAGFALPGFVDDSLPTLDAAFPSLITDSLSGSAKGPALLDNQAMSGWTSQNLLDQLNRGDYDHVLQNADIVTLTIGSNDLLGPFIDIIKEELELSDIGTILEKDKITIREINEIINTKIPTLINTLNDTLADNIILNAACEEFKTTIQPQILAKISHLAPDAQIYWTTLYNPFYGQKLDMEELFPGLVGSVHGLADKLNPIDLSGLGAKYIEHMNQAFDMNTKGYHRVDLYETFNTLGITNVNISRNESTNELCLDVDPHPNTEGHQEIYKLLSAKINDTYGFKEPPRNLSNEKSITAFSLAGMSGTIDENTSIITVRLPSGTILTNATASFATSDGAQTYVGETAQVSGTTPNDFRYPLTYRIVAEDGTSREYTVKVVSLPPVNTKVAGGESVYQKFTDTLAEVTYRATKSNSPLTGISVKGELDKDAVITVTSLDTQSTAMKAFEKQLAKGKTLGICVDIQVSGQHDGTLTVTLPVGTKYNGMDVRVFHYVNGEIEILKTIVTDGVAVVQTSSLSPFAVEFPILQGEQTTDKDTTTTPESKPEAPSVNTGDSSSLIVLFTLLLASGGTLIPLLARRRKTDRDYSK